MGLVFNSTIHVDKSHSGNFFSVSVMVRSYGSIRLHTVDGWADGLKCFV